MWMKLIVEGMMRESSFRRFGSSRSRNGCKVNVGGYFWHKRAERVQKSSFERHPNAMVLTVVYVTLTVWLAVFRNGSAAFTSIFSSDVSSFKFIRRTGWRMVHLGWQIVLGQQRPLGFTSWSVFVIPRIHTPIPSFLKFFYENHVLINLDCTVFMLAFSKRKYCMSENYQISYTLITNLISPFILSGLIFERPTSNTYALSTVQPLFHPPIANRNTPLISHVV